MTNDTVALIHAHLSTEERLKVCTEFVEQLQSFGYEVIVTTHTPAPIEFQQKVNYFVYDHDNCLLFEPESLGYITWFTSEYDVVSKEFFKFNSSLAVHRLLHIGVAYAKMLGKKNIHIFDYDGYLENSNEMKRNEEKLNNGLNGVFYHRGTEGYEETDKLRSGERMREQRLQIVSLFMSAKVDYLLKCFEDAGDFNQQKSIQQTYGFLVGEEYMSYVLKLTKYNSNPENNVEVLPFLKTWGGDVAIEGMIQDRVGTNEDTPWVCLIPKTTVQNDKSEAKPHYLFLMNIYADSNFEIYFDDVFYKNFNLIRQEGVGQYNAPWILEPILETVKIDIKLNGNHFRTYDLRDENRMNVLTMCNSLFYKT